MAAQPPAAPQAPPAGMVEVPAGVFLFGPKKKEVVLDGFWIDPTPVTNAQFAAFLAASGRRPPQGWPPGGPAPDRAEHPVVGVTLADAEAYAAWAGKVLPTPAQFEKAARGSDGRKYPWGDDAGLRTTNTKEAGVAATTPVEAYPRGKSPFGCFDMAGNVLHWTRGAYDPQKGTQALKGSSFRTYLGACAWSHEATPTRAEDHVGFRCVWKPPAP